MFKSKIRDIVIPQYEHARLAGLLASLWGNDQFARPAIDFDAFVNGVTFHDRGYGVIDNAPIGESALDTWLDIERRGIAQRYDDPAADIVALMHIRRLLASERTPKREGLMTVADERIQARLAETTHTLEPFQWADRITQFCDNTSFSFCFEQPTSATFDIFTEPGDMQTTTPVTYIIELNGLIKIAPWPLGIASYSGFIVGYKLEGYPDRLEPVLCHFQVVPG